MIWQDMIITFANVIFSAALVPQVIYGFRKRKGLVTLTTSGPTAFGLFALSITYYTLSLPYSTFVSFITGTLWLTIFLQRLVYEKV